MPPASAIQHYENFPVASWLCPARLRPAVAALYHFARTADDLADEGDTPPAQRLDQLQAYRSDLMALYAGTPLRSPWAPTIGALLPHIHTHAMAQQDLLDLLDAFEQDVHFTAHGRRYADWDALLDYCRRSANPVGRLMLRLMLPAAAITPRVLEQSDQICTALQLLNFWQDLSVDIPRGRHYIPQSVWLAHRQPPETTPMEVPDAVMREIILQLVDDACQRMHAGAPLARQVPGRLGWELRGVVQGGLRIAQHIRTLEHQVCRQRPRLKTSDAWHIAWRCWRMGF